LDELYNKWFNKRVKCIRKATDDKIRIDVEQYKGVYLYLGLGLVAAIFVLLLEQALYKYTIPFLRSKPKKSEWKSLKLMFISQVF
jgi:ionotropic glutamate receptor NMDA 3A